MPEGDTIYRTAATLHRALAGKVVTRFETALANLASVDDQAPLTGRTIERVVAAGKHLIIDFSGDLHLRTHMRMSGSWHIYRPGERWQAPRREMRIVIATAEFVAVGFSIPVAELLSGRELERHGQLRALGPDFLGESFDDAEAKRRMRERGGEEIGNVLLDQRVAAGVGNIYKSESLFVADVSPFLRVEQLDDAALDRILAAARKLLRQAVGPNAGSRRWVYERGGEPCRECGTPIAYRKQGPDARGTYWCPQCQASPASSSSR
jgi:endonuclease-8